MFNAFVRRGRKPRIKTLPLVKSEMDNGGLGLPEILSYYYAARLSNMVHWWNPQIQIYWEVEQLGNSAPLAKWALMPRQSDTNLTRFSVSHTAIMKVWGKVEATYSWAVIGHIYIKSSRFSGCARYLKFFQMGKERMS